MLFLSLFPHLLGLLSSICYSCLALACPVSTLQRAVQERSIENTSLNKHGVITAEAGGSAWEAGPRPERVSSRSSAASLETLPQKQTDRTQQPKR